jgi:Tricorn protease PDZ domain
MTIPGIDRKTAWTNRGRGRGGHAGVHRCAASGQLGGVVSGQSRERGQAAGIEHGRYRFARVYNGENWNPQLKAPLTQPGVNVKAGEYLLAVNGRELRATDNVHAAC